MSVTIEEHQTPPLEPYEKRVLKNMFTTYNRLVIRTRLKGGLSGSSVFLVRPVSISSPELPAVVKIDLHERIEQEWMAFTSYIRRRLPSVAEIQDTPVNPPGSQYSGLWYPLAGADIDKVISLHQYLSQASAEEITPFLEKRLFRRFEALWQQAKIHSDFHFRASYDDFLPLNLKIECAEATGPTSWLHPETIDREEWAVDKFVQVAGFKVVKLLRKKQGLSLDTPEAHHAFRLHVYGLENISEYEIGQIIQRPFTGRIIKTRQQQLVEQAKNAIGAEIDLLQAVLPISNSRQLPNPLLHWKNILWRSLDVRIAGIHGDLNMENVLVDPDTETVHLIDFAKSRWDHVLRDLLHLEMTVINRVLSTTIPEGETAATVINNLYRRLHCTLTKPNPSIPPPLGLEKIFAILLTIRRAARHHIFHKSSWNEYYYGLFIYLLGSLRYKDLDKSPLSPLPKQLAFWGAAVILDLIENEPDCTEFEVGDQKTAQTPSPPPIQSDSSPTPKTNTAWDIDKIIADWQADALTQRLILFNLLKQRFSMKDLGDLAFNVGIDLDDLPSSGKSGKAQELIGYFERRGHIRILIEAVRRVRPSIAWK